MTTAFGNIAVFNTLTDAMNASIPIAITDIQTFAYAVAGDSGGATYKRLASAPAIINRGYFQDADDEWFALTSLDANVKMFGCVGDLTTNDQASFQDAIDYSFNVLNTNLYVPSGCYQVETLVLPGRTDPPAVDDRNKRLKLFGQGIGEGYAIFPYEETGGTKIVGATDAVVLDVDDAFTMGASSGLEICDLCFIASGAENENPVVRLRITQNSSFHHNILYQEGVGDGLHIAMAYQADIAWNRIFNQWWVGDTPESQTGVGIRLFNEYSPSQVTIQHNTCRTFLHAGVLGNEGGAYAEWQLLLLYNEASICNNGWTLHRCDGGLVMGNYIEGAEGGIGFKDLSHEVNYIANFIFPGCSTVFDFTDESCRGPKVSNCNIRLGDVIGARGIKVTNDDTYEFCYSITNNYFEAVANTNDVIGIEINGTSAMVNISGNEFNPNFHGWGGTGSAKIAVNVADEGLIGLVQYDDKDFVPYQAINNGQITFTGGTLTRDDVPVSTLTIGPKNYYTMSATSGTSVYRIVRTEAGDTTQVTFRLTDANVSFNNSGYVTLAGSAAFSGPGAITFAISRISGSDYAYELSRTVY